ncbi:polysaccharide deacetylase [Clostridium acetobutylicum]|nr:polysaccharide deacetylase [Clostridium acetobutylicum]
MNKPNERKKILIKRSILVGCAAVICWTCFFIFGTYYKKRTTAAANEFKNKAALSKKAHHNSKADKLAKKAPIIPGYLEPWKLQKNNPKKTAYLTFDDGPSPNTTKILDILNANKIKATFFILGKNAEMHPDLVKLEYKYGNSIGNHTYSHNIRYNESTDEFLADVNRCDSILKSILGDKYTPKLLRFPGGSGMPRETRLAPFRQAVTNAGYRYLDWNDETGDAEYRLAPVPTLMSNLEHNTGNQHTVVVLMHDAAAKTTSVDALPQVIQYLKNLGYTFDKIS